ncbi:MAG TPA: PQQ-dependent sugar dehydrogenase [Azospirillum sp.]|nr:PQQ-dependent sugar dehydrogenase [Azospirillum sp.]
MPGDRFFVDPLNLPPPQPGMSVNNTSVAVARPAGVLPQVPAGFEVTVFAEGLESARWIEVAPNGDVLMSRRDSGDVLMLRDVNGDGRADTRTTLIGGFTQPHGMAFGADGLYVVDLNAVWKVPYVAGDATARGPAVALTAPGALGGTDGHTLHSLALSPDGQSLFVGIGSEGNLAEEPLPRASVLQFDGTGASPRVLASGMRNPAGLEIDPATGTLYAAVVERDGLGDELVPDFLTRVQAGGFYGWPYAYIGPNPQPGFGQRPDLVASTLVPDVLFRAHSTPIGFTFYTSQQFPSDYTGDIFVALRGSWNSSVPHGFMIARVAVENGVPVNGYEAFMTGFLLSDQPPPSAYGRPTTVAVAANGTLLVGDDTGGTIYAVRYAPKGDDAGNILTGGGMGDTLSGLAGNDTVHGERGNDTVQGGQGEDQLWGDLGGDRLSGDAGNDVLNGGAGADIFAFAAGAGADRIEDFHALEGDRIELSGLSYGIAMAPDGEALLTLSDGSSIQLTGIAPAGVSADWFVGG